MRHLVLIPTCFLASSLLMVFAGCPVEEPPSDSCVTDSDCVAPASQCLDENTLQEFAEQGVCNLETGECEYTPLSPIHCPACPLCEDDEDPPPDPPVEDFDIIFSLDFDDTPIGPYLRAHWSADWGIAAGAWSDPCRNQCADEEEWAGARLFILEEDGNRFMRHELTHKGLSPGTSGTQWWKGLEGHDELYLSYRIRFVGSDWTGTRYDGKLPGFCGGGTCPGGGNPPLDYQGFSTRYMFKNGIQGLFFYLYYAGMDTSSSNYGNSLYFNPYDVDIEEWHTITQRVVMNSPGQSNGIVEGFHNGALVAQKTDMDYRNSLEQEINMLIFGNFLGGSGDEPSAVGHVPTMDFDDFVIFRYADSAEGVPRGQSPWPAERTLIPPSP